MKNIKFNIALLFAALMMFSCEPANNTTTVEPSEWFPLESQIGIYNGDQEQVFVYSESDHQFVYSLSSAGTFTNRIQNDDVTVYASLELAAGVPETVGTKNISLIVKCAGLSSLSGIVSYSVEVLAVKNGLAYLWDSSKSMGFIVKISE